MAGVTHFERRDRQKLIHAECGLCLKRIKGTPRKLAGELGEKWYRDWMDHIEEHLMNPAKCLPPRIEHVRLALETAAAVAREYDRNK